MMSLDVVGACVQLPINALTFVVVPAAGALALVRPLSLASVALCCCAVALRSHFCLCLSVRRHGSLSWQLSNSHRQQRRHCLRHCMHTNASSCSHVVQVRLTKRPAAGETVSLGTPTLPGLVFSPVQWTATSALDQQLGITVRAHLFDSHTFTQHRRALVSVVLVHCSFRYRCRRRCRALRGQALSPSPSPCWALVRALVFCV